MSDPIDSLPIATEAVDIDQIRKDATRAETAAGLAEDAVNYDHIVADDTALAALVMMTTDEVAYVRSTQHLHKYDGTSWVDIGEGPSTLKADKAITYAGGIAPYCTTSLSSYTITVTPVDGSLPPLANSTRVSMMWPLSSDGTNKLYLKYGTSTKEIRQPNGASIALPKGMAIHNFPASLRYQSLGVGYWVLESDQLALRNLRDTAITVEATSSDGLTYDLKVPYSITGEPFFWLETTVESTGTVIFTVNGLGSYEVRYANNGFVGAGVIKPNQPNIYAFRGSNFVLIGTPYSIFSGLSDEVDVIESRVGVIEGNADALRTKDLQNLHRNLIKANHGEIEYVDGARTVTPKDVVVIVDGNSIFAGATSGEADDMLVATQDGAVSVLDTAPGGHFFDAFKAAFEHMGNYNFIRVDVAVDGSSISDSVGGETPHMDNVPYSEAVVGILGYGANDADTARYHCGQTLPGARAAYINAIKHLRDMGAVPLVYTTVCAHPTRADRSSVENIPAGNTPAYPYSYYKVKGDYVFDASAHTITSTQFSNTAYGGAALAVGETISITNGDDTATNAGNHTITAISVDRNTITVNGTLTVTGTENVKISHTYMDEETYLIPPPSERVVSRDWSGNGVDFSLDVNWVAFNSMLRELCAEMGVILIDADKLMNKYVAENGGDIVWGEVYGAMTVNLKHGRRNEGHGRSYYPANEEAVAKLLSYVSGY